MQIKPLKIFIVEDNSFYAALLEYHLKSNFNCEIHKFDSGSRCLEHLHLQPAIITLDYHLPDISGLEVLRKIKAHNIDITVIVISGQEEMETAVSLFREGAYDYLIKDEDTNDRLWQHILNIKEIMKLKQQIKELKEARGI